MRIVLLSLALLAAQARAEDDCGRMDVEVIHVTGVVRAIAPLADWRGTATSVGEADPRYVVSIGPTDYAVHSPSRLLGTSAEPGARVAFQLQRMECDGVFRRYLEARPEPGAVRSIDEWLEVGEVYRATVRREATGELALVESPRGPMHHGVGIEWIDADGVAPGAIEFEVVSRETTQVGAREWVTIYRCAIRRQDRS